MILEIVDYGKRYRISVTRVDGFGRLLQVWPVANARLSVLDHGCVAFGGVVPMPHNASGRPVAVLIRPSEIGAEWRIVADDGDMFLAIDGGRGILDVTPEKAVGPANGGGIWSSADANCRGPEAAAIPATTLTGSVWTVYQEGGAK